MLHDRSVATRPSHPLRADHEILKTVIERRLRALTPPVEPADTLGQAVRYALLAPGKRIRPLLTMLTAMELGANEFDALDVGCALEMVHAASLILDDLPAMDDSPVRRGRPATHVAFGEDTAVLAAVALLSRAHQTLAETADIDAEKRCVLVTLLAQAIGLEGLSRGQFRDLQAGRNSAADEIANTNHLKTGLLFVASVDMAAVVAGASEVRSARMRLCTTHLGQAFQILNDLADPILSATDSAAGKQDAKPTLVSLLGVEEAHRVLGQHVALALGCLTQQGSLARFIRGLFESGQHPAPLALVAR